MKVLYSAFVLLTLLHLSYCMMDGEIDGNDDDDGPVAIKPKKKTKCRGTKCEIEELDESGLQKDFINSDYLNVQLLEGLPKKKFKKVGRKRKTALDGPNGGSVNKPEKLWYGEDGDSTMTLMTHVGNDGEEIVVGSMTDGDSVYQISRDDEGQPVVKPRKTSDFPDELEPRYNGSKQDYEVRDRRMLSQLKQSLRGNADQERRRLNNDDGAVLDVLVAWTSKAECKNSGKSASCTRTGTTKDNMLALIDLAVEETNRAYDLSGIDTELNLVHAYIEPNYNEYRGFEQALDDVTDGKIGKVHDMRDQYGADIVALIIDHDDYCGVAWLGPEEHKMFSVTSWSCATGYYSFGHEIGHNMGCNHDRGTSNACSVSSSNYGYRDPNAGFRSILSYNCNSGQCDNNRGGGCQRVMRFSNKKFKYNNKPIGDNDHDNASRINSVKSIVAAYRQSKDATSCSNNADCNDGDQCTTNTCVNGQCQWSLSCSGSDQKNNLDIPLDADTGNAGNMFNVKAKALLQVEGVGIHTSSTNSVDLEVWTRPFRYFALGNSNKRDWKLVQRVTVKGLGEGKVTPVPNFNKAVPVRKGEVQAFYVTLKTTELKYTRGNQEGGVLKENKDMVMYEGIGVEYPFGPDTWQPRNFNGPIKYSLVKPEKLKIGVKPAFNGNCKKKKGWYVMTTKRKNPAKKCPWVGRKKDKRCPMVGTDGLTGYEACPVQCWPSECAKDAKEVS